MKKYLLIILTTLLLLAAWRERFVLQKFFGNKIASVQQTIQNSELGSQAAQTLADFKDQVFTGGALRSDVNAAGSHLTLAGTLEWTNKNRAENGLPALAENSQLKAAASAKLKDMFAQQYFEHKSPQGKGPSDLAKAAGYNYVVIGENLALGNFKDDQALLTAWMNSPGHRANILNVKFTQIGIAVGRGLYEGKQTWLAVQEFGKPLSDCPVVDKTLKTQIEQRNQQTDNLSAQISAEKQKLDSMQPQTREEYETYNAEVQKYNDLVHIYNNQLDQLKQLVGRYNDQVKAFNACAK